MMNKFLFTTALLIFTATAQGDDRSTAYAACEAEAKLVFDSGAKVKLRNLRRQSKGYKLKLKVSGTETGTRTATCVFKDGQASIVNPPKTV